MESTTVRPLWASASFSKQSRSPSAHGSLPHRKHFPASRWKGMPWNTRTVGAVRCSSTHATLSSSIPSHPSLGCRVTRAKPHSTASSTASRASRARCSSTRACTPASLSTRKLPCTPVQLRTPTQSLSAFSTVTSWNCRKCASAASTLLRHSLVAFSSRHCSARTSTRVHAFDDSSLASAPAVNR